MPLVSSGDEDCAVWTRCSDPRLLRTEEFEQINVNELDHALPYRHDVVWIQVNIDNEASFQR